jgi:hypothetical protein
MPNSLGEVAKPLRKVETLKSTKLIATPFLRPMRSARAEDEGAEHHAEQRIAAQRTGLHRRQAPLFHQHRQYRAVDEQVIAVEDQQQCAQAHHHPVEARETRHR